MCFPFSLVISFLCNFVENGKPSPWDEVSAALSAKKSQLLQENVWSNNQSSSRSSWSSRGLRGSALGPTMALLRSQKGL